MLELVLFDATTITRANAAQQADLARISHLLHAYKVKVALVSTDNATLVQAQNIAIIQNMHLDYTASAQAVIGTGYRSWKGSGDRITHFIQVLNIAPNATLYVGDDDYDIKSAINANAIFLFASWSKAPSSRMTFQPAATPNVVWAFASHFLMQSPRWDFTLDRPAERFRVRSPLSANTSAVQLTCDPPQSSFDLFQLLKLQQPFTVAGGPASGVLFWHAIASAHLEGLLKRGAWIAVYPGHMPNSVNATIQGFMQGAARALGHYFKPDLLVRAVPALQSHRNANTKAYHWQTDTVHLHSKYRTTLGNKSVIVLDDFHTKGMSLDWARSLLLTGGASEVTLVTLGKFGISNVDHWYYTPNPGVLVQPFVRHTYGAGAFSPTIIPFTRHVVASPIIQHSFSRLTLQLPYF